jgi:hypothetical protein
VSINIANYIKTIKAYLLWVLWNILDIVLTSINRMFIGFFL